ncbi:MAG: tetratricopeptide repeat protein [Sideroxyarcus sp.]|nr:tetratricopeptide repeat protein [Sideroxyarcus sp.]
MNQQHNAQTGMGEEAATLWDGARSFFGKGLMQEALAACQQVLEQEPEHFDAVLLAGRAMNRQAQPTLAENFFRYALSLRPDAVEALNELAAVLAALKQNEQSLEYYRRVLELQPDSAQAHFNVSTVLFDLCRMQEALRYCQQAIELQSDLIAARVRHGMILYRMDDLHVSLESLLETHLLAPDDINVLNLIALNKIALGLPDEAVPYLEQVLSCSPGDAFASVRLQEARNAMQESASVREALYNSGLIDEAEKMARDDLVHDDSVENHNFLLKCYLASARHSSHDLFLEGREWARTHEHEDALPNPSGFKNKRDPNRRLRVGIVGDYFAGVIGVYTLIPFFKLYDRSRIELFCYNFGPGGEYVRTVVDRYRDISPMSGEAFFKLVRDDVIDIMLDINGRIRTPNHFETLLRQPAPIQVNWYNLPCTVGVKAFNYAIADDYCIRPGEEADYVEKVFRMPTSTICAWDMGEPPVMPPPPSLRNGYVTFGCFGDFFKIGEGVLEVWARLLKRVPDARLYLKSNNLRLRSERERISGFFRERGVDPQRLIMEGLSSFKQMKKCYEWVDIAIDTFPYSSGSTTINALWQSVPVIAIEGDDWRGRSTAAVLAGAQLDEFIARDVGDYVDKACALAADPARLAELRATLGKRMAASPQWDVKSFARNFETRLRMIWQDWLKTTETEKKIR